MLVKAAQLLAHADGAMPSDRGSVIIPAWRRCSGPTTELMTALRTAPAVRR
jgi:hypothetical protein